MTRNLAKLVFAVALVFVGQQLWVARKDLGAKRDAIHEEWPKAEEALRKRTEMLPELLPFARSSRAAIEDAGNRAATAADQASLIASAARIDRAVELWIGDVEGGAPQAGVDAAKERLREGEVAFATARRKYNAAVQAYNIALEPFPNNLAARLFGMER